MSAPSSAPLGPSRSRGSLRGRGSTRGLGNGRVRSRGGNNARGSGRQSAFANAAGNQIQRHLGALPRSNQTRSRGRRNAAASTATSRAQARRASASKDEAWRTAVTEYNAAYKERMSDLYQQLKRRREIERKEAIKNGFLADPDKPTSLANAITPVGTCPDLCPEFERVERIVQMMVDTCEKEIAESGSKVPCEALMVKRFRRSAAGYDEQLPSDIRPPTVLKKTLDYLMNDVVGGAEPLAAVHKFVWDRTRGIRNDFSIQQVTKVEDLRLAIECFERIARFHILSLHQLSRADLKDNEFDHHQEREQLNNTLLSLMYYYDDSRQKLSSPNEAEFRAYCIIFEIRDQRPDLEDRVQSWPRSILRDPRVQTALKIYAAAGNISDEQGPLRPRSSFSLAQGNAGAFWAFIDSNSVSYLTACVAEIYFNLVRGSALELIWKAYKAKRGGSAKVEDWIMRDLTPALGFDNDNETATFCEEHGFVIANGDNDDVFVDLGSVASNQINDSNPRRKQIFSRSLVEKKRLGRTLPAVIDGLSASQAQQQGFVDDAEVEELSDANDESLFLDEDEASDSEQQKRRVPKAASPEQINQLGRESSAAQSPFTTSFVPSPLSNPFARPAQSSPFASSSGAASGPTSLMKPNPFAQSSGSVNGSNVDSSKTEELVAPKPNPFAPKEGSLFNPFVKQPVAETESKSSASKPTFNNTDSAKSPFSTSDGTTSSSIFASPFAPNHSHAETKINGINHAKDHTMNASSSALSSQPTTIFNVESSKPPSEPSKAAFPTFSWMNPPAAASSGAPGAISNESSVVFEKKSDPSATTQHASSFTSKQASPFSDIPSPRTTSTPSSSSNLTDSQPQVELKAPTSPAVSLGNVSSKKASEGLFKFPSFTSKAESQNMTSNPAHLTGPTTSIPTTITTAGPTEAATKSPVSASAGLSNITASNSTSKPPLPTSSTFNSPKANLPSSSTAAQVKTPIAKVNTAEIRTKALDQLADIMMTEEGGLLQQFVEYSVTPIIRSCVAKFEDEKSWARAKEYRPYLLEKKYFARWKRISWNLGLQRRAKERRSRLATSVLGRSQRPNHSSVTASRLSSSEGGFAKATSSMMMYGAMQPPSTSAKAAKRQSMPAQLIEEGRALLASFSSSSTGQKRKREDGDANDTAESTALQRHKRSNTLAATSVTAPPHTIPRSSLRRSIDSNRTGDGSLLGSVLKDQAQKLAPYVKADTTNTDYFKLKALGIDPDTPLIPRTKRKAAALTSVDSTSTSSVKRIMPAINGESQKKESPRAKDDDDDEALFASIRKVRDTLSESTSWFQTERQSIERSMTPQSQASPPRNETAAERRLRELKERGPTPTRSEMRYRAMKDKSHLPNGFWDKSPAASPLHNGGHESRLLGSQESTPSKVRGFAALTSNKGSSGMGNGLGGKSKSGQRDNPFGQSGGSPDEAIEL